MFHGSISLSDISGHSGNKRNGMFCSSNCISGKGVNNEAAKFHGGLKIHIVDSLAGSSYNSQPSFFAQNTIVVIKKSSKAWFNAVILAN